MTPFVHATRGRARSAPALLCLLALSSGARAQTPPEPPLASEAPDTAPLPPPSAPPLPGEEAPWTMRFGLRLGAGMPEGLGVEALVQPRPWLRVHAGAARNSLGTAARAGMDLLPVRLFVSPVLGVEYGHGFALDYEGLLTRLHGQPTSAGTRIRRVDADQLSVSVGLEYSPWRPLTLFGGVGISYWFIRVRDVTDFVDDAVDNPDITSQPLHLSLSTPVARLGLMLHFN